MRSLLSALSTGLLSLLLLVTALPAQARLLRIHARLSEREAAACERSIRAAFEKLEKPSGMRFRFRNWGRRNAGKLPPLGHWDLVIAYPAGELYREASKLRDFSGRPLLWPLRLLPYGLRSAKRTLSATERVQSASILVPDPLIEAGAQEALAAQLAVFGRAQLDRVREGMAPIRLLCGDELRRRVQDGSAELAWVLLGREDWPEGRIPAALESCAVSRICKYPELARKLLDALLPKERAAAFLLDPAPVPVSDPMAQRLVSIESDAELEVFEDYWLSGGVKKPKSPGLDLVDTVLLLAFVLLFGVVLLRAARRERPRRRA